MATLLIDFCRLLMSKKSGVANNEKSKYLSKILCEHELFTAVDSNPYSPISKSTTLYFIVNNPWLSIHKFISKRIVKKLSPLLTSHHHHHFIFKIYKRKKYNIIYVDNNFWMEFRLT